MCSVVTAVAYEGLLSFGLGRPLLFYLSIYLSIYEIYLSK